MIIMIVIMQVHARTERYAVEPPLGADPLVARMRGRMRGKAWAKASMQHQEHQQQQQQEGKLTCSSSKGTAWYEYDSAVVGDQGMECIVQK